MVNRIKRTRNGPSTSSATRLHQISNVFQRLMVHLRDCHALTRCFVWITLSYRNLRSNTGRHFASFADAQSNRFVILRS